ncbi:indolepyruvate oxidoreductase subunit beta [Clostridium tunisiense]|uniref:indolepyruvate oxidoreductase subunit beta n=1 Tax=Clostridium tunisiense TaxID=219748 RepID=UPI000310450C|nr:indolepyruvate oxidoreductase subunit beta [Clostridium tunisiense]
MECTNILICGVGGQGLVVTTNILSEVAFLEGYDIKTSDVIGLSQRGGLVFGSIRFGEKVHSALIPQGEVDILLALEKLEGLRWVHNLKKDGIVILNNNTIYPNRVLIEKEEYPEDIESKLKDKPLKLLEVDGVGIGKELGNLKVENTVLLGALSNFLPFSLETWHEVLSKTFSSKLLPINKDAFNLGRNISFSNTTKK